MQGSPFNRRITGLTEIEIAGPARGHALLVTKFSTDGTKTRGTLNNCGTGKTPWGTLLTGEENWTGYFFRAANDQALRTAKANTALARYGRNVTAAAAAASRYGWETAGADDKYARWNTSQTGASADGSDDYRHEINGQGFITEIDPYNATSVIKKRTALGRMAHESAAFANAGGRQAAGRLHGRRCRRASTSTSSSARPPGCRRRHRAGPHGRGRQVPRRRQALRRQVQRRRHAASGSS